MNARHYHFLLIKYRGSLIFSQQKIDSINKLFFCIHLFSCM
nr:MAG TPA: hypothetical protein [Caudoviricetes sp.]